MKNEKSPIIAKKTSLAGKSLLQKTIKKKNNTRPTSKDTMPSKRPVAKTLNREDAERYRNIIANIADGYYEVDLSGNFTFFNDAVCRTLGYSRKELTGKNNRFYTDKENVKKVFQAYNKVYKTGETLKALGYYITRKDGYKKYIEGSVSLIINSSEKPIGFWGIMHDFTEGKQAEESLQEAVKNWQATFDAASDAICLLDKDQRILRCNKAMAGMFGMKQDKLIGRHCWEVVHGTKEPIPECPVIRIKRSLTREETELQMKNRWFNVITDPILDETGTIQDIVHIVRDITERKRVEEELRREEQRFRTLAEQSSDIIAIVSREGFITYENPAVERFLGIKTEERIGFSIFDRIHPDDLKFATDVFKAFTFKKSSKDIYAPVREIRIRHYDGSWRTFETMASKLLNNNNVEAVIINLRDITERKKSEDALCESEERLRLLSEAAFEAIVIHEEGVLLNANDQYFKMFGYEPGEALGKEMISVTFAPEILEFVKKQVALDRLGPYEAIGIRKDGTMFPIEIRARKMEYKGRIVRFGAILDITERKKAEAALRESEEKYRLLADQSIMGMFIIQEGNIKYVNYATAKITGYSLEEMMNWQPYGYSIVLHPDESSYVMEQARRKQTGDPDIVVNYTWRIITKSGEIKWVNCFSKTISFEGSPADYVMIIDITEGKTAQEELQKSEANFRLLAENAPDAIFIRIKLKFAYVNNAALNLFGADSPDQLIGQSVMDRFHPDSRELIRECMHLLDEKKLSVPRNEQKYLKLDGTTIDVEVSAVPFRYKNIDGSLVFVRDICERKKAEKDLQESEELFRYLFRYHAAVKLIIDPDTGCIIDANEAAVKYYGWPREEITRMKVQDINISEPEEIKAAMEKVRDQKRISFEFRHRKADGSIRDVEIFSSNIKVQGNDILHTIVYDITERKRAEEELNKYRDHLEELVRERTAELEAFSYSVSHDLRAPLRTIDGFGQALLEDYDKKLDTQGKDYLARIRTATSTMAELIEDMLKLSRITRSEMDIIKVNLSNIAKSITDELRKSQPQRIVNIKIADSLEDWADPRLMRIVLENLLGNAWKFTGEKEPAEIEFGLIKKDKAEIYFVRDNGAGFDMEYEHKLFAPFQRLHNIEEYPGTGIGLAIIKRIIHRHGGKVWAEGEPDKGATFYFTLQ